MIAILNKFHKSSPRPSMEKGFKFDTSFLMKLVIGLLVAYITLITTSLKTDLSEIKSGLKEQSQNFTTFVIEIKPKLAILEEKLINHIGKN